MLVPETGGVKEQRISAVLHSAEARLCRVFDLFRPSLPSLPADHHSRAVPSVVTVVLSPFSRPPPPLSCSDVLHSSAVTSCTSSDIVLRAVVCLSHSWLRSMRASRNPPAMWNELLACATAAYSQSAVGTIFLQPRWSALPLRTPRRCFRCVAPFRPAPAVSARSLSSSTSSTLGRRLRASVVSAVPPVVRGFCRSFSSPSLRPTSPSSMPAPFPAAVSASSSLSPSQSSSPSSPSLSEAVQLTDAAAVRIAQLRAKYGSGMRLRLSVDSGGCSGLSYKFEIDHNGRQHDDE